MTNYQTRDLSRSVRRTSAVESYHDALNLSGTVYPIALYCYALLCVAYARLSSFIAEQRSYALYCRGVMHSISLSTQCSEHNTLTSAPVLLNDSHVVQAVVPVLSDADMVSLPMVEVSEEVKTVVRAERKARKTDKSRRKVKVEGEVYTSAANAGIEVTSVVVGPTKYTRKGLECLTMAQLREIGNGCNVKGRSKAELVERILAAQNG